MATCTFASPEAVAQFALGEQRSVKLTVSFRKFWDLSVPYWRSPDKVAAWLMLVGLAVISLCTTALHVQISFNERSLNTALSERKEQEFYNTLYNYLYVIIFAVPFFAFYSYLQDYFVIRWRRFLTSSILNAYFEHRSYYAIHQGFSFYLESSDNKDGLGNLDNPDQRISEDIRTFTQQSVYFLLLAVQQVSTLIGFSGILFSISPSLMVFLLQYALIGTFLTVSFFGKRLVPRHADVLKAEADFRYALVRVAENAESVAFYRGEPQEQEVLGTRFNRVLDALFDLIVWQRHLAMFKNAYHFLTYLIPPAIIAPQYLKGDIEFGVVAQTAMAFRMVLSALTVLVQQFQDLSKFSAGVDRLYQLSTHLEKYKEMQMAPSNHPRVYAGSRITRVSEDTLEPLYRLEDVTVTTPTGFTLSAKKASAMSKAPKHENIGNERILVKQLDLDVSERKSLLIVGSSGAGKSSVLRTIAGLWSFGSGRIACRSDLTRTVGEVMFLPQKPYMLLGSLRAQLLYPNLRDRLGRKEDDSELRKALKLVGLPDLEERVGGFEAVKEWEGVLSVGEKQRLAFARVLLQKPKLLFLDEATSALDVENETRLYDMLRSRSFGINFVSVGHRPSLVDFHDRVLRISSGGAWQVMAAAEYKEQLRKALESIEPSSSGLLD